MASSHTRQTVLSTSVTIDADIPLRMPQTVTGGDLEDYFPRFISSTTCQESTVRRPGLTLHVSGTPEESDNRPRTA